MSIDDRFRLILIVLFAIVLPFAMYHRLRSRTGERLDRWQEGVVILFGLRLSGIPFVIGGILWMVSPGQMAWASVPLPVAVRWIGVGLVVTAALLLVWTFRNLGKNLTDTVVTRQEHSLVTSGPYRYVRHPFYLAGITGVVGASLVAANWFFLLAGTLPYGLLVIRTRTEEEKLIERFGDDYREYMARTGRFLPRLRRT